MGKNTVVKISLFFIRIPLTEKFYASYGCLYPWVIWTCAVVMDSGAGQILIEGANRNGGPLRLGTAVVDIGQAVAVRKRKLPNRSDAVRDGYTGQALAEIKRILPNGGNAVRDGYAGQVTAAIKRPPSMEVTLSEMVTLVRLSQ